MPFEPLKCLVLRPSELGEAECTQWREMQAETQLLHRAFYSPTFALSCERAGFLARVATIYDRNEIHCFFPFQFRSRWHERLGLAERIGGQLSDACGLIARKGFSVTPSDLLRLSRLAAFYGECLLEGQDLFGLTAYKWETAYLVDLAEGPESYFQGLRERHKRYCNNTEQSLRRTVRAYGQIKLTRLEKPSAEDLTSIVSEKRAQYRRTNVPDALADPHNREVLSILRVSSTPDCASHYATLTAGEQTFAQHLGLAYKGTLNYWFPVYNHEMRNLSPGRLLLWELIRNANSMGVARIDFGEGEATYKRYFATGSMRVGKAAWSAGNFRSVVARTAQSAEWRLRSFLRTAGLQG